MLTRKQTISNLGRSRKQGSIGSLGSTLEEHPTHLEEVMSKLDLKNKWKVVRDDENKFMCPNSHDDN